MKKENLIKWLSMVIVLATIYCFFQNENIWLAGLFVILGCLNIIIKSPFSIFYILIGLMLLSYIFEKRVLFIILLSCIIIISVFDSIQLIKLMISKKSILINNKEVISHLRKNGLINKIYNSFRNK
jgi:hypothetical protein